MEQVVAKLADISLNSMLAVSVAGYEIVIFRAADGALSALHDRCSHADVKLSRGIFANGVIQCKAHGAKFDAKTGKQLCMPAVCPVASYKVREVDGEVLVDLPEV